jgi:hypothetical protein
LDAKLPKIGKNGANKIAQLTFFCYFMKKTGGFAQNLVVSPLAYNTNSS